METQLPALLPPDSRYKIRPVRLSDVVDLRVNCWSDRSHDHVYRKIKHARQTALQGRGLSIIVPDADSNAIAFGQFTMWPRCGEISDLIVAERYRGQGIGTAMIQYLTRTAREMHAGCVEIGAAQSNPAALALYRRLGFKDLRTIMLDLGNGNEPVVYLRIKFKKSN